MIYVKDCSRIIQILTALLLTIGLVTRLKSASPEDEVSFTVQEIVDALNLVSRTITDGEITLVTSSTMDITDTENDVKRSIRELSRRLKQAKSERVRKRISKGIQLHKDWLKLLQRWPIRDESYVTFKVPQSDTNDELQLLYKRMHSTDKRGFEQKPDFFESLYHKTQIVSGEHLALLIVTVTDAWDRNAIGNNAGSVEKSALTDKFSFHLLGRVRFKVHVDQVEKVYREDSGLLVMELDLGKTMALGATNLHRFYKLWIDPRKGFSVVREEGQYQIDGKSKVASVRTYKGVKEYPGGIWYPTSFEFTSYTIGTEKIDWKFTQEIVEGDFNIGVPVEFFEFTLEEMKQIDILLTNWYEQPVFTDVESLFPRRLWETWQHNENVY